MTTRYATNPDSATSLSRPRPVGLVLVAYESAVNIVGLATRYTARAWSPQVETSADKVARELVSRAVETTGIPGPHPRWIDMEDKEIPLIEVRLRLEYLSLVIEVWDGDETSPLPPPGAYLDDHLVVVHEQAQRWNWFTRGRGKVIWAELGIPPQRPADSLSRRTAGRFPCPAPEGQGEPLRDVEAMRRVRDGLLRLDSGGSARDSC